MTKTIYAFSADPIHYGHLDIINRASNIFEEVIVGIGNNPEKSYLFSLDERLMMTKKVLQNKNNIKVISFQGLLVDYAYENNIPLITKGIRGLNDLEYEMDLHNVGVSQNLGIETNILLSKPHFAHISSKATKAIQKEQGLLQEYVPLYVKQKLEEKISKQYLVGLTGEIGSGKSYLGKKLVALGKENNIPVHNIELDEIAREIMTNLSAPQYQITRTKIINHFGGEKYHPENIINRQYLAELVFNNQQKLKELNEIMATPILVRLRKEIYQRQGLIILNSALLAESEMTNLCNHNVINIYTDKQVQYSRLKNRGLSKAEIKQRLQAQFSTAEKESNVKEQINKDQTGQIWKIDNSKNNATEEVKELFNQLIHYFRLNHLINRER